MHFIKRIISYLLKILGYRIVSIGSEDRELFYNKIKDILKKTGVFYLFFKTLYHLFTYVYNIIKYFVELLLKKKYYQMSVDDSRVNWKKRLIKDCNKEYTNWRGPEHVKSENLSFIEDYLKSKSKEFQSILDIGSYDGCFTKHYLGFKRIYCADLFKESGELIKSKFGENIEFILLNGFDLKDIRDNSIDIIFSMDSLNRAPRSSIINYFREFNRVIRNNGELFVHIPSCYHLISIKRGFTFISPNRMIKELKNFENITLNNDISAFGPVLQAKKYIR